MSWVWGLLIVAAVYLAVNLVVRRLGISSFALSTDSLRELIEGRGIPFRLLDLRSAAEYREGHIPTAINLPRESLGERAPDVAHDTLVVIYSASGADSLAAKRSLRRAGFTNVVNFGPLSRWQGALVAGSRPTAGSPASGGKQDMPERAGNGCDEC